MLPAPWPIAGLELTKYGGVFEMSWREGATSLVRFGDVLPDVLRVEVFSGIFQGPARVPQGSASDGVARLFVAVEPLGKASSEPVVRVSPSPQRALAARLADGPLEPVVSRLLKVPMEPFPHIAPLGCQLGPEYPVPRGCDVLLSLPLPLVVEKFENRLVRPWRRKERVSREVIMARGTTGFAAGPNKGQIPRSRGAVFQEVGAEHPARLGGGEAGDTRPQEPRRPSPAGASSLREEKHQDSQWSAWLRLVVSLLLRVRTRARGGRRLRPGRQREGVGGRTLDLAEREWAGNFGSDCVGGRAADDQRNKSRPLAGELYTPKIKDRAMRTGGGNEGNRSARRKGGEKEEERKRGLCGCRGRLRGARKTGQRREKGLGKDWSQP